MARRNMVAAEVAAAMAVSMAMAAATAATGIDDGETQGAESVLPARRPDVRWHPAVFFLAAVKELSLRRAEGGDLPARGRRSCKGNEVRRSRSREQKECAQAEENSRRRRRRWSRKVRRRRGAWVWRKNGDQETGSPRACSRSF